MGFRRAAEIVFSEAIIFLPEMLLAQAEIVFRIRAKQPRRGRLSLGGGSLRRRSGRLSFSGRIRFGRATGRLEHVCEFGGGAAGKPDQRAGDNEKYA